MHKVTVIVDVAITYNFGVQFLKNHSKQATLHTAVDRNAGSYPREYTKVCAPFWVSTIIGSDFICHYKTPKNLNSQQVPQFGQSRQAPGTSQLCPTMLIKSHLPNILVRLEYCTFKISIT
jgi:hypothetical protein